MMKMLFYFSFNVILFASMLLFQSCGKADSSGQNSSITAEEAKIDLQVDGDGLENDEQERAVVLQDALDLKLKPSSIKRDWEVSYSKSIIKEFSKKEFDPLFEMELNEDDLALLNCTGFNRANDVEKMKFYLLLLSSIAEAESDFKNESTSTAPNGTTNIGLFQIDKKAAMVHAKHAVPDEKDKFQDISNEDLRSGEFNSQIGSYILKNQLTKKGPKIFRSDYYWEVLFPNRSSKEHVLRYFKSHLNEMEFCK